MKKTIIITALTMFANTGYPAVFCSNSAMPKDNYALFYVNGLSNTLDQAIGRTKSLSMLSYPGLKDRIEFGYAYQQNETVVNQMIELIRQANMTSWDVVARYLYNLNNAPPELQEGMINIIANMNKVNYVIDSDLRAHITAYRSKILGSKKVILLPHSQGNYYANDARDYMSVSYPNEVDDLAIVGLAPPTNRIAGEGFYTTMQNDVIINAVRTLNPSILNANYVYSSPNDPLGHGFDETYMNLGYGSASPRSRVIDHIVQTAQKLSGVDSSLIPKKTISVKLDWTGSDGSPNMNLHIYEPGGDHLYWDKLNGASGYMSGVGDLKHAPKQYYVDCGNMMTGTYNLGVRYYSGSTSEKVTIDIKAGDEHKVRSKRFNSSGLNSHIHDMGSIEVTGDENSGYNFTIR